MAMWSIPWGGSGVGHSGPYSDVQWATMHQVLFGAVGAAKRGVLLNSYSHDDFRVRQRSGGANMSVDVAAGAALINGRVVYSDSTTNLAIAAADGSLNRIDLVVARTDVSNKVATVTVRTGTPAASPTAPTPDTSNAPYYEIPLARVYVGAGVSSILDANITDLREPSNLPTRICVPVYSASELFPGDVVAWQGFGGTNRAVITTTTEDDPRVAGVVVDHISAGGTGRICIAGLCLVKTALNVGLGRALATSTTARKASYRGSNAFAWSVHAESADLALAYVCVRPVYPNRIVSESIVGGDSVGASGSFTEISSSALTKSITTKGGDLRIYFEVPIELTGSPSSSITYYARLDAEIDGTRYETLYGSGGSNGTAWLALAAPGVGGDAFAKRGIATTTLRLKVDPGSHTVKIVWRLESSGGTPTITRLSGVFTRLVVEEVYN